MAATSGSRRITAPSSCCRRIISCGDTAWAASEMPEITPVSWLGKKPLGICMAIVMVSAKVAKNTHSMIPWWRSAMSSVRR
jgi:hypothetical protein